MARGIDSRDVLDPNGRTRHAFDGRVVGHYRRTGPNAWDPYERVDEEQGEIRVLPGIKIQLEEDAATFRMRRRGGVIRVAWEPSPEEQAELREGRLTKHELFVTRHVEGYRSPPGFGLAAVIARKLSRKRRGHDD